MEAISLKLDKNMLNNIDNNLEKNNFSTRTEFIRDSIRDKLESLKRDKLIEEFMKFRGKANKKTTYKKNRKTRERASKELMAELEKRFN